MEIIIAFFTGMVAKAGDIFAGRAFKSNAPPTPNTLPATVPQDQVSVPKDIYKEGMENAVRVKELEMQAAHGEEKALLQKQIDVLNNRLENLPQAFQEAQERIASLETALEREGNEIGAEKLAEAKTALENGDFSKADELFAEIQTREDLAVQRSARAAYARGEIADQEIRWHDAAEHYARAAQLDPCFETLTMAERFASNIGNYDSALSLGLAAKKMAIAQHEEESEEYSASLNNLAVIYLEKGNYEKAEQILNEAIKIKKQVFGENAIETAISLNNIAMVYQKQELYDKAEPIFKQVLEIYTEAFGENDHQTADALNNLAGVYQRLGPYEKAEKLHNKALTIRRQTFKKNHPYIANSLYNLARVYQKQRRYQESEPLCKEALKIVETTLGPDHPHTILVKGNYKKTKEIIANAENDASQ